MPKPADFSIGRGVAVIEHLDGARKVTVDADFTDAGTSSTTMNEILNKEVIPDVLASIYSNGCHLRLKIELFSRCPPRAVCPDVNLTTKNTIT